jgi:hypothetical protein
MLELLAGPVIKTRYMGWTQKLKPRILATHRRDSQVTYRSTFKWDDELTAEMNHQAAAQLLLDYHWKNKDEINSLVLAGRGHDADGYYWLAVARWRLKPQQACA